MKRRLLTTMGYGLTLGCSLLLACSDATTDTPTRNTTGSSTSSTTGGTGGSTSGATTTSAGATATSGTTTASGSGSTTSSSTTSTTASGGSGGASPGSGGSAGSGTGGSGGSSATDAGSDASKGGSGIDADVGDATFPPITECPKPSVDRIEQWMTSAPTEGTTIPPSGNLVVMEGDHYVAKVQFIINNGAYCVCPVYLNNAFSSNADLSTSTGFLLTYSSTADMYVQARPTSHWSGGDQWATLIPTTGGVKKSVFFSFDPTKWKSVFGTPTWTFASTLKEVLGFVFVGNKANVITFYGLRFDGFTPTCR